jgi:type I restriction enzyme S subunit
MNSLNTGILKGLPVLIPPFAQQRSIYGQISNKVQNIGQAITDTNNQISLLREYRTRLIADVVAGKFDVREAAAKLPD